jgi:hypothetical protein
MPRICLLLVCAGGITAIAQSNFATLNGSLLDAQSRPLRDARVAVRAEGTGAVRNAPLNSEGLFEAPGLPPGDYTVEAQAAGFAPLSRHVRLEVGQQMRLDLTLSVGEKRESVNVSARAEILKTSDASLGEVVENKSIDELPLNGRMLLDLALTVPGSHLGHGAQAGDMNPLYWRPGQASAITVGGARPKRELLPRRRREQYRSHVQHTKYQPFAGCRARIPGADRKLCGRDGRRRRRAN